MGRRSYTEEFRQRAVKMFRDQRGEYDSDWAAMTTIAQKLGIGTTQTLSNWVRRADIDEGVVDGVSSAERTEIKDLKREVKELRRANEILKAASVFFAAELDPRPKR